MLVYWGDKIENIIDEALNTTSSKIIMVTKKKNETNINNSELGKANSIMRQLFKMLTLVGWWTICYKPLTTLLTFKDANHKQEMTILMLIQTYRVKT